MAEYSMKSLDFAEAMWAMVWSIPKTRYCDSYPLNCLYNWGNGEWSADCNNLIKAGIWGRCELPKNKGGYWYNPNRYGLGDLTCKQMIDNCEGVSTDFSKLKIGELLFIKGSTDKNGHVGLYVGDHVVDGKTFNVVESSPIWYNGIQSTYVDSKGRRIRPKTGEQGGTWEKHGVMYKWLDYSDQASKELPLKYNVTYNGNKAIIDVIEGKGQITVTTTIK